MPVVTLWTMPQTVYGRPTPWGPSVSQIGEESMNLIVGRQKGKAPHILDVA